MLCYYRAGWQFRSPSSMVLASSRGLSGTSSDEPVIATAAPAATTTTSTASATAQQSEAISTEYVYGTVRNYLRPKGYGFIVRDGVSADKAENLVFVHRQSIKTAKLLPPGIFGTNPVNIPYLLPKERVRFRLGNVLTKGNGEKRAGPSKQEAIDLEFENGTPVPIYRNAYMSTSRKLALSGLGEAVYKFMTEEGLDPAVREDKIKIAFDRAQRAIRDAQERYDTMNRMIKQMS
jgi:cold shock CspA family protein